MKKATKPKAKTKTVRANQKLGSLIDKLYQLRQARLAAQKTADKLKSQEHELRQHLLKTIPRSELSGAKGKIGAATLIQDTFFRYAEEGGKDRFLKHLQKTGEFDLIVFHINAKAAKDRLEEKQTIPGLVPEPFTKLSVTKA